MSKTNHYTSAIIDNVKQGDLISFYTCSNADRKLFKGIVAFKDQLGLITIINGIQYELRYLIDITIINKGFRTAYQFHHLSNEAKNIASQQNKGALLTQWLYNADGTLFECSTVVQL